MTNKGQKKTYTGVLDWVRASRAYVLDSGYWDVPVVRAFQLGGAMHGDTVQVQATARTGKKLGWRIVKILRRARTQWVGRLAKDEKGYFLVPDHKYVHRRLAIAKDALGGASVGDKVLVQIQHWAPTSQAPLHTQVALRLGASGEHEAEMHSLLLAFDIPTRFPKKVQAAAEALSDDTQTNHPKREDFRPITTFTIDPADAKDFDDALSVQQLPNKRIEVGIHIADVSHYVKEGSVLDQEAAERSTSVYLVDRTVPMLPERLSNGLCSLQPHCDRLCFSVIVTLNEQGKTLSHRFAKTLIHSDHRFTYEEAQQVLDKGQGPFIKELKCLHLLAYQLRKRRFGAGALQLHAPEFEFELNGKGVPLSIRIKPEQETHFLIEEFMLLANRQVAEYVAKHNQRPLNFIYRVHAAPDQDKLATLARYASKFGHKVNFKPSVAAAINQLMTDVKHTTEATILNTLAIRAMAPAEYSCKELHHFGLGLNHYTHFTSPIRRYPDLMAHRLLSQYLSKKNGEQSTHKLNYAEHCTHASAQEKRASEVERASIKYKQVEYMQKHIGECFDGMVSGLTEWGIYVTLLPHQCEGMVRLSSLGDDYYALDAQALCLRGKRSGKRIEFGDPVQVQLLRADLEKRSLSLALTKHTKSDKQKPKHKRT